MILNDPLIPDHIKDYIRELLTGVESERTKKFREAAIGYRIETKEEGEKSGG